jgi:hypothetical protein
LKPKDALHGFPFGATCACAVKLKAIAAPLHRFLVKISEIWVHVPASTGFGDISDTKLVEFPPNTESKSAGVLPVFVRL